MSVRIDIKGVIVSDDDFWIYEWFGIEATSPKMVNEKIENANGKDLEVIINSGGGSVYAGSEIYTAIKDYPGNKTVKIVGVAASAASIIAMAGDKVLISPPAQIMIHNTSTVAHGDHRALEHGSNVLKGFDRSMAYVYMLKTGLDEEELLEMMSKETWLTAQEALEKGFVDEIMFDDGQLKLSASLSQSQLLPPEVINKIKNEFVKHKSSFSNQPVTFETNKTQEEVKKMDLETLKNEHPELYNQVFNSGVEQERNRIKALDELTMPGNEGIINKAKYETFATAEQTAIEILKAQKEKRIEMGTKLFNDAQKSGVNNLDSATSDHRTLEEVADELGTQIANIINERRGGKK